MDEALDRLIDEFVALFRRAPRQRTPGWLNRKGCIVGGSELATVRGENPYSTAADLLAQKCGLGPPFPANVPCAWGTMFEPVTERLLELDCGTRMAGTDIHIDGKAFGHEGHGNSPDGFCQLRLVDNGRGGLRVLPADEPAAGREVANRIALVELKAPYRRVPRGGIPRHYRAQVMSGLELTPIADVGLFVDAVYRLCSLLDLGPSPHYNARYHYTDRARRVPVEWGAAFAWGLTLVWHRPGDAEAAYAARRHCEAQLGGDCDEPVDYGDSTTEVIDEALLLVGAGGFRATHLEPQLREESPASFAARFAAARAAPPPGFVLHGLLPWKVMRLCYDLLPRPRGFLDETMPLVRALLAAAERVRAAEKPREALARAQVALTQELAELQGRGEPGPPPDDAGGVSADQYFAWLSGGPA